MPEDRAGTAVGRKRCFVVMGFGVKTDFATGRKLDLDKSYRLLIKPVIEGKSLECIRADEIRHSGSIDVPMYQELLTADVVVADLSTANPNALYELGIRHALRPRTTIVISENKLSYPFDLNHVMITGYTHLGDAIDFDEVMRFREVLGETIEAVLRDEKTDSPVYTFLSELVPPALGSQRAAEAVAQVDAALQQAGEAIAAAAPEPRQPATGTDPTLAMLVEQGEQAIQENNFTGARAFFEAALQLCKAEGALSHNSYLIQRLALATYKSKQPDEVAALHVALGLLEKLHPNESNDPETVGLAGAIEKRLFDNGRGDQHLSRAIWFYGRGYYLRNDWYNGINLAYLLNVRMSTSLDAKKEERIADLVWANRLRREVLALCEEDLRRIAEREERVAAKADKLKEEQGSRDREQKFWCLTTRLRHISAWASLINIRRRGLQRKRSHLPPG
jgi:MAP3K TRAFs-binding domain